MLRRSFGLLIRDFADPRTRTRSVHAGVLVIRADANEWRMNGARSEWRKVNHGSPYRCAPGFRGCTEGRRGGRAGCPLNSLDYMGVSRSRVPILLRQARFLRLFRVVHHWRSLVLSLSRSFFSHLPSRSLSTKVHMAKFVLCALVVHCYETITTVMTSHLVTDGCFKMISWWLNREQYENEKNYRAR